MASAPPVAIAFPVVSVPPWVFAVPPTTAAVPAPPTPPVTSSGAPSVMVSASPLCSEPDAACPLDVPPVTSGASELSGSVLVKSSSISCGQAQSRCEVARALTTRVVSAARENAMLSKIARDGAPLAKGSPRPFSERVDRRRERDQSISGSATARRRPAHPHSGSGLGSRQAASIPIILKPNPALTLLGWGRRPHPPGCRIAFFRCTSR